MKRYFVASDIHGFFTEWMNALKLNGFDINNDNHIIIVCGDVIDRGIESDKIIDFLLNFPKQRKILILGNHEELFIDMIYRGYPVNRDVGNGTYKTYQLLYKTDDIMSINEFKKTKLYNLINEMVDYYETDNYIFTHSWIPYDYFGLFNPEWRNATSELWYRARWIHNIEENIKRPNQTGKTIVCGHKHAIYGHLYELYGERAFEEYYTLRNNHMDLNKIYYGNGIINLDCNTYKSNNVGILVLTEEEI